MNWRRIKLLPNRMKADKNLAKKHWYALCHLAAAAICQLGGPWAPVLAAKYRHPRVWVGGRNELLEPSDRRSEWNEGNWLMLSNSAHVSPVRDNTPQWDFLCDFCISHVAVVCSFVTLLRQRRPAPPPVGAASVGNVPVSCLPIVNYCRVVVIVIVRDFIIIPLPFFGSTSFASPSLPPTIPGK